MVPEAGIEPARPEERGILNPLRLPIPPFGLNDFLQTRDCIGFAQKNQAILAVTNPNNGTLLNGTAIKTAPITLQTKGMPTL